MKKALGQTVRDIKREVNKKVLKVPSIEQKVLDATSNEPWGPHGSLLADIAQATRNYHEYQMIMSVIWKRINDTGKNWRHVYKALTVLEYLVAHGSERVIDEIREHAYQISTLSDFQYIDSSGRDQGNNVRKKSQSLVVLVNDKERIQEVRQKAAANRDKYRTASAGSMYRPGSGGYGDRYDDDRYGNRDDDRNGYGREREWASRDDDRYGRYGDSYSREGDRYSRDSEDRYSRDDDYRGRSQNVDDYRYGSRSRSADRDRDHSYEDDGQYSSRGSGAKPDDHSQDGGSVGKRLDRKYSEQNLGAPPSYEDAVGAGRSPTYSERDGESSVAPAPKASSPTGSSPPAATAAAAPPVATAAPTLAPTSPPAPASTQATTQASNKEVDGFDEFDPRGSFPAAPATSNGTAPATSGNSEMDFLGSLSDSFALALVPTNEPTTTTEANAPAGFSSGPTFAAASSASPVANQPLDDPFGDGPFRAVPSGDTVPAQQQGTIATNSFNAHSSPTLDVPQPVPQKAAPEFGGNFYDSTYLPSATQPPVTNTQFMQQEPPTANDDFDILADILPPSTSSSFGNTQNGYPVAASQPVSNASFPLQTNQLTAQSQNSFQAPTNQHAGFPLQTNQSAGVPTSLMGQTTPVTYPVQGGQASQMGFYSQTGQPSSVAGFPSQMGPGLQTPLGGQSAQQSNSPNPNLYGTTYQSQMVSTVPGAGYMVPSGPSGPVIQQNFLTQSGTAVPSQMGSQASQVRPNSTLAPVSTMPPSTGSSSAIVPQPSKDKFETKSTVWADTLSRGLVNLNISGPKTNPLADIGVDFDAINRKEKRMEKPTTATVTSTVTMGKAMGSGTGMGRAGAGALRPPPNPMIGAGMNMGMGGGPPGAGMGMGMGMGGYGVNQPMMGRGMSMPGNMGMGMNMGMNQGIHMQQQTGYPPNGSTTVPGGYNPMMGPGTYGQQPYGGGGYR